MNHQHIRTAGKPDFIFNTGLVAFWRSMDRSYLEAGNTLARIVQDRFGLSLNTTTLKISRRFAGWGGLYIKQYPDELAKFLQWIYQHRQEISNYLEIGCERGGTFFAVDSLLRAFNPEYRGGTAVDVSAKILRHGFAAYRNLYPETSFHQVRSRNFAVGDKRFDLVLIDGDHSYNAVKADFEHFRASRFVALHDIRCPLRGIEVRRFWAEIAPRYPHVEIVNEDPGLSVPVGIGIVSNYF